MRKSRFSVDITVASTDKENQVTMALMTENRTTEVVIVLTGNCYIV